MLAFVVPVYTVPILHELLLYDVSSIKSSVCVMWS